MQDKKYEEYRLDKLIEDCDEFYTHYASKQREFFSHAKIDDGFSIYGALYVMAKEIKSLKESINRDK